MVFFYGMYVMYLIMILLLQAKKSLEDQKKQIRHELEKRKNA